MLLASVVVLGLLVAPDDGARHGLASAGGPRPTAAVGSPTANADTGYDVTRRAGAGAPATHEAANPKHEFRASFSGQSVRVAPQGSEALAVALSLRRIGTGADMKTVGAAEVRAEGRRAELVRDGVVEWYVNDERGLEQGFLVERAPESRTAAGGELKLELALSGNPQPRPTEDGQAVEFVAAGQPVLRYAGLKSWDARRRDLPSRMQVEPASAGRPATVTLVVDTAAAEYPVTIDPIVSSPWTYASGSATARAGNSIAMADVNGDGYKDVIVGAPYLDGAFTDCGRVMAFYGSASGPSASPSWSVDGSGTGSRLGAVGAAGDVNGDGYEDVIVGAPGFNGDEGQASVYLGGSAGLQASPVWTVSGGQAGSRFGISVSGAGDVNGDGYGDIVIGADGYSNGQSQEGRAVVYYGSAGGPSGTPWTAEINEAGAAFGRAVAGGGDFNRDGYADIAIGAPLYGPGASDGGQVFVYHGASTGLPATPKVEVYPPIGSSSTSNFGASVAVVGDADGDGFADLLVGEPGIATTGGIPSAGRATLYRGSSAGILVNVAWTYRNTYGYADYGRMVASAGDVNGDGYADWVVGAPRDSLPVSPGNVSLYQGAPTASLSAVAEKTGPIGSLAGDRFGIGLAFGDVNGDSLSDVVIGADGYDGTSTDEGRLALYLGQRDALGATAVWHHESNTYGGRLGWAIAAAGDVNGDGYSDVAAGAPRIGNGSVYVYHGAAGGPAASPSWRWSPDTDGRDSVGRALSSADVNGDGYSDLVVGDFNWSNPGSQEGRILVFYGSASGLPASPSWSVESNIDTIQFGMSVAGVGDVNGDGYEDVLVGAPFYTGNLSRQGAVFLYLGSPTGLRSTTWFVLGSTADEMLGSENGRGTMGRAGDVNGDGYADIVLGETDYSDGEAGEGRVMAFYGGSNGPPTKPNWSFESNQAGAMLGIAVSTAGDVNGDGFADVVAGAYYYDNGQTDEGRVFVFHGSAAGLPAGASWTWEPNSTSAHASWTAAFGDVNADGYADLFLSSTGYVFLGSATGLPSFGVYWGGSSMGIGAGDVDGDGVGDVFGANDRYNNPYPGDADEGAVFLYTALPSATAARKALPRMLRGGSSSEPVQPWGRTYDKDDFKVSLNSVSWFGRGLAAKVEVEACPTGVAFGSASCVRTVSPSWTELTTAAGATDTLSIGGLQPRTLYRWRARTLYAPAAVLRGAAAPPVAARGPWRRLFAQAREADVRTDQGITVRFTEASSNQDETRMLFDFVVQMTTDDGQPSLYDVTVQYQTADGTATAGEDYTAKAGTLTFLAGNTTIMSYPQIAASGGDGRSEGPETFTISLLSPVNAALGSPSVHVATIIDSDAPLVSVGAASAGEGTSGAGLGDATATGTIENDDGPQGDAVPVFAATSKPDGVHLSWVYPATRGTVRIRYTIGSACSFPEDPETSGALLGDIPGTPGEPASTPALLLSGQRVCYSIWASLGGGLWSARTTTFAAPVDFAMSPQPIAWAYTTDTATVQAPGLGGDVVLAVSNNGVVHAVGRGSDETTGAAAGVWPTGYRPRILGGAAQSRPPVIPLSLIPGAGAFALLGSQDGNAYALDTVAGGVKWQTALGDSVQGSPSAVFSAYGAPFDMAVAATRNDSGGNYFYALNPVTGALIGTPVGGPDVGFVSSTPLVHYGMQRAWFTSSGGGSGTTLWCFSLTPTGLSYAWSVPGGDIETSPVVRNAVVYVGANNATGDVMAFATADGMPRWPAPVQTEAGGVRGYVYPDSFSSNLYLSSLSTVRAVRDNGATTTSLWSTAVPSPSAPVQGVFGATRYLFVGGGDGRLYQLDPARGDIVTSLQLGGPTDMIGAPALDGVNSVIYVGSSTGVLYAVKVPLP